MDEVVRESGTSLFYVPRQRNNLALPLRRVGLQLSVFSLEILCIDTESGVVVAATFLRQVCSLSMNATATIIVATCVEITNTTHL